MIVLTQEMFKNKQNLATIMDFKTPIFKLGFENVKSIKNTVVMLNDTNSYEQISSMVFDVASQLKTKTKFFDLDPIGQEDDKSNLLDHFENLAKIFNEKIDIVSTDENPIRKLKRQENMLQILPMKKDMFKKRFSFKFFYTNSDFISFDLNNYNQLLIPIVE
jgi:hypothetical protein